MTEVQKQRLIGAVLLLCIISAIAIFLLVHVSKTNPPAVAVTKNFDSVVQPLDQNKVEMVKQPNQETLLDPHHLGKAAGPGLESTIEKKEQQQAQIAKQDAVKANSAEQTPQDTVAAPKSTSVPTKPTEKSSQQSAIPAKTDTTSVEGDQYVVQLASFSVEANATALKKQLQQMGYQAIIDKTAIDKGALYRVQLDPMSDKNKADQTAAELSKKLSLHPQVLKRTP